MNNLGINNKNRADGFSLISVIVAIGLAGILAITGATFSGQIMNSFALVDYQKDRNALMRTIVADLSCQKTFESVNNCKNGQAIELFNSKGENIQAIFLEEWEINARCRANGVHVLAKYIHPMPKEFQHYNNKTIDVFAGSRFCGNYLSQLKNFEVKTSSLKLTKNANCDSANFIGEGPSQKPQVYEGEVRCLKNYHLLGGGAHCKGLSSMMRSVPIAENGIPVGWRAACCAIPGSFDSSHQVFASCRLDLD